MEIKEEHKSLLRLLGLRDEDFDRFDGKRLTYEWDEEKGVRIYDPHYMTSYSEYINIDGWSAWSSENDTFQKDILGEAKVEAGRREQASVPLAEEEVARALKKRFRKRPPSDSE